MTSLNNASRCFTCMIAFSKETLPLVPLRFRQILKTQYILDLLKDEKTGAMVGASWSS
jgi:hypothetical protein